MWIEIIGWVGMVALLSAFYLASSKRIRDDRYPYHVMNLLGAVAVFVNALAKGVRAVAAIEVAWALIALIGIWKVYAHARRSHALE